jgi:hypothetical protein
MPSAITPWTESLVVAAIATLAFLLGRWFSRRSGDQTSSSGTVIANRAQDCNHRVVLSDTPLLPGTAAFFCTGFDIGSFKCRNLLHGNIPRRMLCPKNVALRPHSRIGFQKSARHNPKLLVTAQLWQSGSTVPTEATGKSRIVLGVNESPNEILTTRP